MACNTQGDKVAVALIAKVDVIAVVDLKRSCVATKPALTASDCELALARSVVAPAMARDVGSVVHIVLQFASVSKSDSHHM